MGECIEHMFGHILLSTLVGYFVGFCVGRFWHD